MGWISINMIRTDRKHIKEYLDGNMCEGYSVVKSVMVGSTYYAAVRTPEGEVFGVVTLTSIDNSEYFNFSYKDIEESMGPNESRCPDSILNMLSPTGNEWANVWRNKCREYNQRKRVLRRYPAGKTISVDGHVYEKSVVRNRTMWVDWGKCVKLSEARIAEYGFEVV